MKKYNNFLSFIVTLLIVISFSVPVYAQEQAKENNKLFINFSEFQFVTDDYNTNEVHIEYEDSFMKENAYVIDNNGKVLENISVNKVGYRLKDVYPHTITRSVKYGGTTVEFSMNVELYSSGSFRQINSYQGGYVGIATSVTNTRLEGYNYNAWSPTGFPTVELYYAFNGTIVAEVTSSTSSSVTADLLGNGFSVGATVGGTTYYRRSFNSNGIVKLYN